MLEKILAAITELVTAINNLTAAVKAGVSTAPKAEAPKADTKPKEEKPKGDKPADKKADTSAELKAIQEQGMKLIKAGKQEAVKAVLKEFGAGTFTQLKADAFAKVKEKFDALEKEEAAPAAETPAISLEKDVLPIAKQIVDKGKDSEEVKQLQALLKEIGAPKVSAVPADKLADLLPKLKAILEPKAATSDDSLV
jgi:hypothetical protein